MVRGVQLRRMAENLYEARVITKEEEMVGCYSRGPLTSKEIIRCCSRSSLTSVLGQEKIEFKSLTFWTNSDCIDTPVLKRQELFHTDSKLGESFMLESKFHMRSSPIGITSKFFQSVEISTKQSDVTAESESNYKSKGVASSSLGPIGLVRPRVSFRLPWDVLPPPWQPPLAPI